jgi:hypothetical protein
LRHRYLYVGVEAHQITSARLPGVSVPVTSSMPNAFTPFEGRHPDSQSPMHLLAAKLELASPLATAEARDTERFRSHSAVELVDAEHGKNVLNPVCEHLAGKLLVGHGTGELQGADHHR